jgi:dihydropyrimidinase
LLDEFTIRTLIKEYFQPIKIWTAPGEKLMSLLVKNGRIVTSTDDYCADIFCEGETITAIGVNLDVPPDTEIIDAQDRLVFPGFIDPHVHIYLPFMGTYAKDDYETASRAALVGGTTTLIEMCCPSRADSPKEAFKLWKSKAKNSAVDYTFHMGVTKFDDESAAQLREIVKQGITSFKVFLAYEGAFGITDAELYQTLKLAKELGVIVTAHCENATVVSRLQSELIAAGKTGPEYHEPSRPELVETEGVHHLMTFAELTGAHVYVVHTSCDGAVRAAQDAKYRGVNAWIETVVPYLVLDKTYAEKANFEGAKYVMSPPIRDVRNQSILWDGIRSRLISTVGTDHAPFDFTQKRMGEDDFTKIPNGIPSVEDRVNLLYSYGVRPGKIDLHTLVDAASTQAAKLFDLYPRKGTIQLGADADLVIYDPNHQGTISAKTQQMNVDYSAFEGWEIFGRPETVTVRGEIQVRNGEFVGSLGRGQFLQRSASHF